MPTITQTIGTSGRDWSTVPAWEAQLDNDTYYDAGDIAIGDCYNDSNFEFSSGTLINSGGTIGLDSITLQAAVGQRHTGVAHTGVVFLHTANITDNYFISSSLPVGLSFTIAWIEDDANGKSLSQSYSCQALQSNEAIAYIAHDYDNGSRGITIVGSVNPASRVIVYDNKITSGFVSSVTGITGQNGANCVCDLTSGYTGSFVPSYGIAIYGNAAKNCISTRTTGYTNTKDFDNVVAPEYCLSSDSTANGTGCLINKSAANQFVSISNGSEDYHLITSADAKNAGTDLGTSLSGVEVDIDGLDINADSSNDPWDMGADEFVGAVSQFLIKLIKRYKKPIYHW